MDEDAVLSDVEGEEETRRDGVGEGDKVQSPEEQPLIYNSLTSFTIIAPLFANS